MKKLIEQLMKFGVVGVVAIIDVGVMNLLMRFLHAECCGEHDFVHRLADF